MIPRVQRLELNCTFCLYPVLGGLVLCCLLVSVSDAPRLGHLKSDSLMLEPGDYGLLLCLLLRTPRLCLSWRHQFHRTACVLSLTPVCVSLKEAFASPFVQNTKAPGELGWFPALHSLSQQVLMALIPKSLVCIVSAMVRDK